MRNLRYTVCGLLIGLVLWFLATPTDALLVKHYSGPALASMLVISGIVFWVVGVSIFNWVTDDKRPWYSK